MLQDKEKIDILHLHGFKCAGTTFASILQSNYGAGVAYIESEQPGDRLPWQLVPETLDLSVYQAVSSHLVTLPPEGQSFARLHVAFVRDPRQRIKSAYGFQRRTGQLKPADSNFYDFVQRMRTSIVSNYQTRHLSPQDFGGWGMRSGWQLRPELVDLDRPDLFVGVVERFDESMVLLEMILRERGIPFDGSYAKALNINPRSDEILTGIPLDLIELDEVLHGRALRHLSFLVQQVEDFPQRLVEFRERCVSQSASGFSSPVPKPDEWHYVNGREIEAISQKRREWSL